MNKIKTVQSKSKKYESGLFTFNLKVILDVLSLVTLNGLQGCRLSGKVKNKNLEENITSLPY